ncbi:response regulator transcription factor [Streptomyces dysideae]|uniref:HTH luxR-type domain-containing protein n=1 Tax=Streptomyces dysideae TaxID=909626 RepID=A0A101UVD9_9ACTN|nr:hypothetical protein AQJ91_29640 [Streptomyces dysideae]
MPRILRSHTGPRTEARPSVLTAQELQIAGLASRGLSNKQIGERLNLSHRTVSTHLYKIFPKLGIASRTELRAALDAGGPPSDGAGRDIS